VPTNICWCVWPRTVRRAERLGPPHACLWAPRARGAAARGAPKAPGRCRPGSVLRGARPQPASVFPRRAGAGQGPVRAWSLARRLRPPRTGAHGDRWTGTRQYATSGAARGAGGGIASCVHARARGAPWRVRARARAPRAMGSLRGRSCGGVGDTSWAADWLLHCHSILMAAARELGLKARLHALRRLRFLTLWLWRDAGAHRRKLNMVKENCVHCLSRCACP